MDGGGLNEPGTSGPMSQPPPPMREAAKVPPPPGRDVSGAKKRAGDTSGSIKKRATDAAEADGEAEEAPASGGGMLVKIIVAVVILGVLGGGLVLVLAVLGGGAAYFAQSGGSSTAPVVAPIAPDVPKAPETPAAPAFAGSKIETTDDRTGVARVPTVLKASYPGGADISITGGVGFKAQWDGKADFDLGQLAEGKYRANITPVGGEKIRAKSFEVVSGKTACAFTFDSAKSDWTGGCQ